MNPRRRLGQLPNAVRRAATHPSWIAENVRLAFDRRVERYRSFGVNGTVSEEEAVGAVTGAACADYRAAVESLWIPNRDAKEGSPAWDACSPLLRLAGALTLLLKPNVVLETGVARGYSSGTILAVMERNGSGRLYSVDLPPLEVKEDEFVGQAIPLEFRHRWDLTIGPSRQVLGSLVRRVAPVDLSLHDADHTYPSQLLEYRTVWPYLRPGGVLLSDDVGNRAFLDFADEVAAPAFLVPRHGNTAIGLMQKA